MRSDEELGALARRGREPVFRASAVNGQGVLETFFGLMHLTWSKLDGEHQLGEDARHRVERALADGGAPARDRDRRVEAALVVRRREARSRRAGAHMNAGSADTSASRTWSSTGGIHLEDLVDRDAPRRALQDLRGALRHPRAHLLERGRLLADAAGEHELCAYVNTHARGPAGVRVDRRGGEGARRGRRRATCSHPCFTGAAYRIIALEYDGRRVGRLIVGPFLPATVAEAPATLLGIDPGIDKERAQALLLRMPRAKLETVTRIAAKLIFIMLR